MIKRATLSSEFTSFTIDQKYYNQKQDLLIDARNSPCFAEIYNQIVEENHIYTMLNASRLWYRKVDITFAIASHDLGEKLQKWNWWDHFTDFAMEKTSKGNLPFLNFIKRLNQKREIMTKVYRKPTQTGHQINHYM